MDGPGSRLAARFRKAVRNRDEEARRAEEEAQRAQAEAQAARVQLLADLEGLARDIGVIRVQRGRDGLTLRYGERYVHFAPEGDHDRVRIELEGGGDVTHALYRQAELGQRWVYVRSRKFRDDRVPLFDAGLEHLLVDGLGLPPPGEGDDEDRGGGGPRKL
ncbi:MAG: hypothetical protein R3F59_15860 [Myxococcota bacterium]